MYRLWHAWPAVILYFEELWRLIWVWDESIPWAHFFSSPQIQRTPRLFQETIEVLLAQFGSWDFNASWNEGLLLGPVSCCSCLIVSLIEAHDWGSFSLESLRWKFLWGHSHFLISPTNSRVWSSPLLWTHLFGCCLYWFYWTFTTVPACNTDTIMQPTDILLYPVQARLKVLFLRNSMNSR